MKKKIEPALPCLETTYAYDATIPCARPEGHSVKVTKKEAGGNWTWGEGHCQSKFVSDPPTYKPESYTAFRVGREVDL